MIRIHIPIRGLLQTGTVFFFVGLLISGIILIVFATLGHEVPDVNYAEIKSIGIGTSGMITKIETQYNITINDEHPSIISYRYSINEREYESKFKTLAPDEVSKLKVGDEVPIRHLDGNSIITTLEPFHAPYWIFFALPFLFMAFGLPCFSILVCRKVRQFTSTS